MNFLALFGRFAESNWWVPLTSIVVLGVWIVGKRYFGGGSIVRNFPRVAASVDLILIPLAIISMSSLVHVALRQVDVAGLADQIRFMTDLGVFLSIAWCLARFVEILILSQSKGDIATYLPGLQRSLLFGGLLFLGLIAFLDIEGFSITGIYVSTGAAAALIAFAMQRTLGDLFAGIALSIEHPFRLGDWIELDDGSQGQIVDINWRATRLRGWDKATMVIPNSELAQQGFKNLHGSHHIYAPSYEVKIPAEVDPRIATALLLEAALRCDKVLKMPLPIVRLTDVSTVPYTYSVWVHLPSYPVMFAAREELFREIHYALTKAGVQIASEIHELRTRRATVTNIEPLSAFLVLKGLDLARSLTDGELEQLAGKSQHHTFDAGTVVLREGDVATAFDVIVNGIVESSIAIDQKSSKVIDRLNPGQYFGITSMIINNPSFLQFTALTDVTLIRIDLDCLRSVLVERPDLSEELAKIVKQRMDTAQETRLAANKPVSRLTLQDILRRMESLFH